MKKNIKLLFAITALALSSIIVMYHKTDPKKIISLKSYFSSNNECQKSCKKNCNACHSCKKNIPDKKQSTLNSTLKKKRKPNCAANYTSKEIKKTEPSDHNKIKERSIYRKQYGQRFKEKFAQKKVEQKN